MTSQEILTFLSQASRSFGGEIDFVGMVLDIIGYRIDELRGDIWNERCSLDVKCYRILDNIGKKKTRAKDFLFEGKGKAVLRNGRMTICPTEVGENGSVAFSIANGRIEVLTRNVRDERLRETDRNDPVAMAAFVETFVRMQDKYHPFSQSSGGYEDGDRVDISITGIDDDDTICCRVPDSGHPISGRILNEELIPGIRPTDLVPYFFEEDVIHGAVLRQQDEGNTFSIKDAYTEYAIKKAGRDSRKETVMACRVLRVNEPRGRITWMTPHGYGGLSYLFPGRDLKPGDMMNLQVLNTQHIGGKFYINLGLPNEEAAEAEVGFDSEEDVLADFLQGGPEIQSDEPVEEQGATPSKDREMLRALASVLVGRAGHIPAMEALRYIATATILSKLIGDNDAVAALKPVEYYLRQRILFARGVEIPATAQYPLSQDQADVLRMLHLCDHPGDDLLHEAAGLRKGTLAADIASLLLGLQISRSFPDDVRTERETIRQRICHLIGVGDQYRPKEVIRTGKYGNAEGHEVEFKSSYVFRNDGRGADIHYQGRGQVFEAVCGFLNADGGTLYLGVNDDGNPIVSKTAGLTADIDWLGLNYQWILGERRAALGHPVNKVTSLDSYVQFLSAEKEMYFKDSVRGNITIEVTEDNDAIRMTVRPSEFEIAYLYSNPQHNDGIAFVRDGGRTVPMSRVQKTQRLATLKKITKEMGFVVIIQEAIDQSRKLIFKDYSSGSSGEFKDRNVVPVQLFYNDENVYCYDLDVRDYRQFRLHRIGSIEPHPDGNPYPLGQQPRRKYDVFRWLDVGERSYHIKLRLQVGAMNYLLEEYSCAERLPSEEFYEEDPNHWILDTRVYGLIPVRRFYLGLADKIEILDTEDSETLKADIREYLEENSGFPDM